MRALIGVSMVDVVHHVLWPMATTLMQTSSVSVTAVLGGSSPSQPQHGQQQTQTSVLRQYHLRDTIARLLTDLQRWNLTESGDKTGLDQPFFELVDDGTQNLGRARNILNVLLQQNGHVTCWKQIRELLVRGKYFAFSSTSANDDRNESSSIQHHSLMNNGGDDPTQRAYDRRRHLQPTTLDATPSKRRRQETVVFCGTVGIDAELNAWTNMP
jgi:hypothetical protein